VFAAAEAYLEPDLAWMEREQRLSRGERRHIHPQSRQQFRDEARMMGA
jgi:hypothetical protein